eukprot:CAMPEP_0168377244 /NCGR_PEP_ID=MMETSP0228-20121227/10726_1 /TAXON_ID=133427 /ORGANISM="Protoceratium reticulatum, Strain CCCM 535 (=CCMP 1889)" /LENGTH=399 /DNA_ID=CAMNT_0008390235 /DNA_START=12 /DNA_END=1210 /DNA_ORIENTATION=+
MALAFAAIADGAAGAAPRSSLRGLWPGGAGAAPATSGSASTGLITCGVASACALALVGSRRRGRVPVVSRAAVSTGQKVIWNGNQGTVAFIGTTQFAPGEWVGIALDEPKGVNNGSIAGVEYFTCPPQTGIFAPESVLTLVGGAAPAPAAAGSTGAASARIAGTSACAAGASACARPAMPKPAPPAPVASAPAPPVAPRPATPAPAAPSTPVAPAPAGPVPTTAQATSSSTVAVGKKVLWNGKPGTVAFIGTVKFASGEWVGVTLDEAAGMHDGTVMGVKYWSCAPRTGVFSQAATLAPVGAAPAPAAQAPTMAAAAAARIGDAKLAVGCKILWNGKSGTVCYMGKAKFGAGEWVGVELDTPVGMHDGTVMGVKYFTCRPKHGVFTTEASIKVTAGAMA